MIEPIMIVLAVMLALECGIFIERLVTISIKHRRKISHLWIGLKDCIFMMESLESAQETLAAMPIHLLHGWELLPVGSSDKTMLVASENVGNLEIAKLEKVWASCQPLQVVLPCLVSSVQLQMVRTFLHNDKNPSGVVQLRDLSTGMYQATVYYGWCGLID